MDAWGVLSFGVCFNNTAEKAMECWAVSERGNAQLPVDVYLEFYGQHHRYTGTPLSTDRQTDIQSVTLQDMASLRAQYIP